MNFSSKFNKLIGALFTSQQAFISDAGCLSEPFRVERGVRQGDPLSPLLYVIAINPLLQSIQRNITGINIHGFSFKLAAYADDLTLGIGSVSDWEALTNI